MNTRKTETTQSKRFHCKSFLPTITIYLAGLVFVGLLLSACSRADLIQSCANYLSSKTTLTLAITEAGLDFDKGLLNLQDKQKLVLDVTATLTEKEGEERSKVIACKPQWFIEPTGIVEGKESSLESSTLELSAKATGVVSVTALAEGNGEATPDSVWLAVTPELNEQEPNNGPAASSKLSPQPTFALLSDSADIADWFYAKVPPGWVYQIGLKPGLELPTGSSLIQPAITGALYAIATPSDGSGIGVNEDELGDPIENGVNTARVNDTDEELIVFLKVTPGTQAAADALPFLVTLAMFEVSAEAAVKQARLGFGHLH